MQTTLFVHPGTRFLALGAIALTAFSAPLRADDWATVRADGSVTRGSTPTSSTSTPTTRDETYDGPNSNRLRQVRSTNPYSTEDEIRHLRSREDRNDRNNRHNGRNGYNSGGYGYINPGYAYGTPNYGPQTYSYGAPVYGYYPPVNQTIIVPPVVYSGPIGGPPPFPWVKQPWITSIPVGGTVYTSPGYPAPGYSVPGYPVYPAYPQSNVPVWAQQGTPIWAYPQTQNSGVYGSITLGGRGTSVTVGGHHQTTNSGYYNGYTHRR